jgi:hypothetical protein
VRGAVSDDRPYRDRSNPVEDYRDYFVCPESSVRWFLAHPEEAARMREKARLEYETNYTAEGNHDQILSIYESVLSAHANLEDCSLTPIQGMCTD